MRDSEREERKRQREARAERQRERRERHREARVTASDRETRCLALFCKAHLDSIEPCLVFSDTRHLHPLVIHVACQHTVWQLPQVHLRGVAQRKGQR